MGILIVLAMLFVLFVAYGIEEALREWKVNRLIKAKRKATVAVAGLDRQTG